MKKIFNIVFIAILTALTTACETDPITISHGVPVKIDPSGVIAPFTYEMKTGELESFTTSYKLRVRLLAYDSEGKLAAADSSFLTNYAGIMNSTIQLPEGVYTLLTITDIVKYESGKVSLEFWHLTNVSDINQAKVTNAGLIGGKNKVLGTTSQKITVTDSEISTINMQPKPAGALLCIYFRHIHQYSDVTEYKLLTNRNADFMTFDSNGNFVTVPENQNNQFIWRVQYINPKDESYSSSTNIYGWNFMFPVANANYKFVYSTATETDQDLVTDMIVNLAAGEEYLFELDLCNEDYNDGITYYYVTVNGNTRSSALPATPWEQKKIADSQNVAKLKDLMN